MPCEKDFVQYKIIVKKELLRQFLEEYKKHSSMIPEIWGEFTKGEDSYWCISIAY